MKQKQIQVITALATVVLFILIVLWSKQFADQQAVQSIVNRLGYVGIFVVSFISGFNIVIPVPVISFWPVFVESGMALWAVVVIITVGMTTGDSVGFLVGRAGRNVDTAIVQKRINQINTWSRRYRVGPLTGLFLYASFAPAPNELVVVPMAFMGYSYKTMFPLLLLGNGVFNTLIVVGFEWIL